MLTAYSDDYVTIHKNAEKVIQNIHSSYNLIIPFAKKEKILEEVQETKKLFVNSLNHYLLCLDAFYYRELAKCCNLLDEPVIDFGEVIKKWILILVVYKEKLKIELENEN